MYKKLVLLLTFIVSFIVSINVVSAAQELTCIYDKDKDNWTIMFQQLSDGTHKFYVNTIGGTSITGANWAELEIKKTIDFNENSFYYEPGVMHSTPRYIDKNNKKLLVECPYCVKVSYGIFGSSKKANKIEFKDGYDSETELTTDECEYKYQSLISGQSAKTTDEEKWVEETTGKRTECEYINKTNNAKAYLSYTDDSVYVSGGQGKPNIGNITVDDILKKKGSNTNCPSKIYSNYNQDVGNETFSLNSGDFTYELSGTLNPGETRESTKREKKTYDEPTDVCTLLGAETIDLINKIMNIIRIIVPILLLIFGVTDFFKAVFSGSSEDMKKDRDRFFKRLIAAVIVFIVPVFVNLVLNLANQVWSDINSETCIK